MSPLLTRASTGPSTIRGDPPDTDAKRERLLVQTLIEVPGSGIVYISTIKQAEAVASLLGVAGIDTERYHRRLAANERSVSRWVGWFLRYA